MYETTLFCFRTAVQACEASGRPSVLALACATLCVPAWAPVIESLSGFVQSDEEAGPASTFCRSRLLSGMTPETVRSLASLTVTFGPVIQIDGPQPTKRLVLPLQPEVLQALLLQLLNNIEEADEVCKCCHVAM